MRKRTTLSTLAAASVTAAGLFLPLSSATAKERPVIVQAPTELVVRHVSYADLDLALPLGKATLQDRVGFAIEDVCTEANQFDNGSFDFKSGLKTCSNIAWNDARPQIDRAVERATQIAATGTSNIAAAAITIATAR
jgi:UrcA family protein